MSASAKSGESHSPVVHKLWVLVVAGSNPASPTTVGSSHFVVGGAFKFFRQTRLGDWSRRLIMMRDRGEYSRRRTPWEVGSQSEREGVFELRDSLRDEHGSLRHHDHRANDAAHFATPSRSTDDMASGARPSFGAVKLERHSFGATNVFVPRTFPVMRS